METITLQDAIREMVDAFKSLEEAKEDCKTVVDSAIDAYSANDPDFTDTDRRSLKKIAKAIATGKKKQVATEAESLKDLVDQIS